jgi:UDPglucose--hexose-1-phosphate uridylyltransferase
VQELTHDPHRRYNPLTDEWVLASAGRTNRPWSGQLESASQESRPTYDPTCYLCPGNARVGGETNPRYDGTFVFTNDFAALRPTTSAARFEDGLLLAVGEPGTCRVICFSPRHDLALGLLPESAVRGLIDVWAAQTTELGQDYRWVLVFENRGQMMGASNPHPHGQIWAATSLPREAVREDDCQLRHWRATGRRLLLDYAEQETGGSRVVHEDDDWVVVVPFWAVWPFETLVIARHPVDRLADLDDRKRDRLAATMRDLLGRYDGLFAAPCPYSMGWHQAPFDGVSREHWQLHAHYFPPVLRSAKVRKFMVGYELLSESQRDITAEEAAARLAAVSPHMAGLGVDSRG